MSYDNRLFNVNGKSDAMLLRALELVFEQEGCKDSKSWMVTPTHGLILFWWRNEGKDTPFPAPMTASECLPFISSWLRSGEAKIVERKGWDAEIDMDGSIGQGWRVYCEDWGHVADHSSAICAIRPVCLWYGK